MIMVLLVLKVSKSQNIFFWNSIAQKSKEILVKILPYSYLKKKMFWDLLTFKTNRTVFINEEIKHDTARQVKPNC